MMSESPPALGIIEYAEIRRCAGNKNRLKERL